MSRPAFQPRGPRTNTKRVSRRARLRQVRKMWKDAIAQRKAIHQPGAQPGTVDTVDAIAPSVEIDFSKLPTAFVDQSSNKRKDGGDDTENR